MYQKRETKKFVKKEKDPLFFRKRKCKFCLAKQNKIDYKDVNRLSQFISERYKIISRRLSGNCSKHQRKLAEAIRRARFLALFPTK